ncbi:MAG: phosphate regulon transcriptional regulator PhoB [Pseudomonadota bacterium]|nr:phosphate regulon transcriptional regulator PhoB [Pseudomonadota bacterium]HJO36228.1 phosphate regulon transcriptional regulator PhoB [Gammaproteobacteria bacterium]
MTGKTVLVVDDEQAVRQMVAFNLEREGYQVRQAADTVAARGEIADVRPDLLLLDWMLPGMSGLEFARALRRESYGQDLPIIMLTARGEEEDMVRGLNVGADDYVTKPFSPRELIARIEAVLRRAGASAPGDVLELGGLRLDLGSHRVSAGEQTVEVGPTEFRLLHFFMAHPERVYSRSQLLDRVWGPSVYVEERTVDVHIRRLRKALERHEAAQMVQTVRGSGYRFSARP